MGLLAGVVDLDLFVDVIEDASHLVLQAIQLPSFSLEPPLVLLVILLQLYGTQQARMVRQQCLWKRLCRTRRTSASPLSGLTRVNHLKPSLLSVK